MKKYISKFIKNIKLIFFVIILNLNSNISLGLENKIILKIDNEIITAFDIKKEARYLINLNPNTKSLSEEQIYEISKNSLIREKIKKRNIE